MPPVPSAKRRSWQPLLWLAVIAAVALVYYGLQTGIFIIPDRLDPWAALEPAAPPNFLTSYKLGRAKSNPVQCLSALARTGMDYNLLADRNTGPGCGFTNAVLERQASVRLTPPVQLSCPMALSFFMWEHHVVQPAAALYFGQGVTSINHLGSYACRNINRGDSPQVEDGAPAASNRSRHATANAFDVAGFVLQGGQQVSVLQDWRAEPASARQGFMHTVHEGACRFFDGTLGPAYNAVHRNHFHLETGGFRMCR